MTVGKRLAQKISPFAEIISGVSHPIRLSIVYCLSHKEMETWEIISAVKLRANVVAHHLHILRNTGWLKRVRIGKRVTYSLKTENIKLLTGLFGNASFFSKPE
jgi:DNA-binding transcriptional ArsR family regulator